MTALDLRSVVAVQLRAAALPSSDPRQVAQTRARRLSSYDRLKCAIEMRLIRCGIAYGEGRLAPAPRNCWDLLHAERDIVLVIIIIIQRQLVRRRNMA